MRRAQLDQSSLEITSIIPQSNIDSADKQLKISFKRPRNILRQTISQGDLRLCEPSLQLLKMVCFMSFDIAK